MKKKSLIIGIKGLNLSRTEFLLLKQINPWGIILFERNIKNISQLKNLIIQIKKCFNDKNFPILIDQEGGRVSRLNNIFDFTYYTQKLFGNMFEKNKMFVFKNYYENYINFLCHTFNYLGININTSPVLDIQRGKSNGIIGDRSFCLAFGKLFCTEICVCPLLLLNDFGSLFISNKVKFVLSGLNLA